jgi:hypothetical protein
METVYIARVMKKVGEKVTIPRQSRGHLRYEPLKAADRDADVGNGDNACVAHSFPQEEQKQKKRTYDVLPNRTS